MMMVERQVRHLELVRFDCKCDGVRRARVRLTVIANRDTPDDSHQSSVITDRRSKSKENEDAVAIVLQLQTPIPSVAPNPTLSSSLPLQKRKHQDISIQAQEGSSPGNSSSGTTPDSDNMERDHPHVALFGMFQFIKY